MLADRAQGTDRVVAVNGPAAAGGLSPGMRLADARALAPGLEVAPAALAGDARALERLADWCLSYSPWVAADIADGAAAAGALAPDFGLKLDLSGSAHLFGGEAELAAALAQRLAGFAVSARLAVAGTLGAAWALARYGADPLAVLASGQAKAALATLPVAALRLEPETVTDLVRLGLRRIADLYELPRPALTARFGAGLVQRLDQALGREAEPLSPKPPSSPFWARRAFPEPIGHQGHIARAVGLLCADICRDLARAGRGARGLNLALFLADGRVERLGVGCSRPSRDPAHLERLFVEKLPCLDAGFGADVLTLAVRHDEALAQTQPGLRALAGAPGNALDAADLGLLVDRIANRLGPRSIARLVPYESHLPERAVRTIAPFADAPAALSWQDQALPPRPIRLLAAPEPVEAMAEVPDGPPVLFRWRGRLHRVVAADGPERIAPEWWRTALLDGRGQAAGTRDYYRVEDNDGARFWLYRLGLYSPGKAAAPRWYLHGLFP